MDNPTSTNHARMGARQIPVVVFGTTWCAATQMVRRNLERLSIAYQFRDMDEDRDAEKQVRWWTGGYASHPTIQVGDDILVEPTNSELRDVLAERGLLAV
jgi:mycoredoxin